jgi:hypothetical protein
MNTTNTTNTAPTAYIVADASVCFGDLSVLLHDTSNRAEDINLCLWLKPDELRRLERGEETARVVNSALRRALIRIPLSSRTCLAIMQAITANRGSL